MIPQHVEEGVLTKLTVRDRHILIGELTSLLLNSDLHRKYLIDDIGRHFLVPIHLDQFRIYKINDDPVAFITWAYLSQEIEDEYINGEYSLQL